MTAEIAVLNRLGVALAADSAVSIGREANKIWTSAEKLFHLSQSAPVGLMVYGNAHFIGIPWETVVKEFRRDLADSRLDRIEQYADRFFRFLASNRSLFPVVSQDQMALELTQSLFLDLRGEVAQRLDCEAKQRGGLNEDEIAPIVDELVTARLHLIREQAKLAGFGKEVVARIRRRYGPMFRRVRRDVFGSLPMKAGTARKISSIALEMLVRRYFGPSRSGVVIAGFGEREAMPALYAYDLEEMVANQPRRVLLDSVQIALEERAVIVPFAQQESVHTFLRGVDQDLREDMRRSTESLFEGMVSLILDAVGDFDETLKEDLSAAINPGISQALAKLFEAWETLTTSYWRPILEIVASLPKDELASMAEALVNLTKFRRRITPERETVGGPIDVAVITKGDGFVWIARKHYFEPRLNPRALARYKREG